MTILTLLFYGLIAILAMAAIAAMFMATAILAALILRTGEWVVELVRKIRKAEAY